jgi:LmbE family N-acetylglucosaminyl deacetylase
MYTVLAIVCHPDDMEFQCAGTLLKCKERGDRVVVANLCSGDLGHMVIMPDELKKIRNEEAKRSCELAGFEHIYGGFDDLDIYDNNKKARDMVTDIIREVDPDFIITHHPDDYMPDHTATAKLVFEASFAATVPHYQTGVKKDARVVPIYYMEPYNGLNFVPTEYVDITPYIDMKDKMLATHESQVVWLKDHDDIDMVEVGRTISRFRGIQCGVQYAECFSQCMVALKVTTKRMLP